MERNSGRGWVSRLDVVRRRLDEFSDCRDWDVGNRVLRAGDGNQLHDAEFFIHVNDEIHVHTVAQPDFGEQRRWSIHNAPENSTGHKLPDLGTSLVLCVGYRT